MIDPLPPPAKKNNLTLTLEELEQKSYFKQMTFQVEHFCP